jgi:hypothetical protein
MVTVYMGNAQTMASAAGGSRDFDNAADPGMVD